MVKTTSNYLDAANVIRVNSMCPGSYDPGVVELSKRIMQDWIANPYKYDRFGNLKPQFDDGRF